MVIWTNPPANCARYVNACPFRPRSPYTHTYPHTHIHSGVKLPLCDSGLNVSGVSCPVKEIKSDAQSEPVSPFNVKAARVAKETRHHTGEDVERCSPLLFHAMHQYEYHF